MRTILLQIVTALLAAALALAADDAKKAKGPLTVPAGAVKVDRLTHRHTDADGKTWIYRRTPFGLVRYEADENETAAKPAEPKRPSSSTLLRAIDEGDSVRFEKQTPFGIHRWVRKKTDLNDEERAAYAEALKKKKKSGAATRE